MSLALGFLEVDEPNSVSRVLWLLDARVSVSGRTLAQEVMDEVWRGCSVDGTG